MAMVISTLRIVTAARLRMGVVRALAAQLGATRVQQGCARCDLYQDLENPDVLILVEEWESQAALGPHLDSAEYRAVLAAIEPLREQPVIHFDTVIRRAGLETVVAARGA